MSRPNDLRPMTPRQLVKRFVARRASEDTTSPATVDTYERRLERFVEWCESAGVMDATALTGRDLSDYWDFRRETLADVSMKNEFGTVKKLLEFGVAIEAVEPDLPDKAAMLTPSLKKNQGVNDEKVDAETASEVLAYLSKFRYASRDHAMFLVLWHTGCRIGGLRALDVEDFDEENAALSFRHRPGTRLKNGEEGERDNSLSGNVPQVLADYIAENRVSQEVDGRRPLFTTTHGRIVENTVRRTAYRLTQPCLVGECPFDRDPETCDYRVHGRESMCEDSLSPHRFRTGAITHMRESGMSISAVSERVDATPETIKKHYDKSDPRELMENRRVEVEKIAL